MENNRMKNYRKNNQNSDYRSPNHMAQDTQDMNASFGRHSGRGNRRENYYQFRRQDSHDSSKLNDLIRKSQEGRLKSPARGQPKNPTQGPAR